jgi:cytochrome c2
LIGPRIAAASAEKETLSKMKSWLVFIMGLMLVGTVVSGQVKVMPGSVAGGERVLAEKGCLGCHSINGKGGSRAPDFTNPTGRTSKPGLLAAEMWNHSPAMWSEFEVQKKPVPSLTSNEAADLYAYFYATLYFAPKGNAARGREVFESRRCASCHGEILDAKPSKSIIEKWTDMKDPIVWAERMWNHSNEMLSATTNRGINWPRLSERDVVDLVTFLSNLPDTESQEFAFAVGEPGLGRNTFERACTACHSFGAEKSKIDLLSKSAPTSVTDYIARMWNHAPDMRNRGGQTEKLAPGEMRNLIAYLFAQRFFFEKGDATKGRKVFENKGCANCHEMRRSQTGAPDLTRASEAYSPITLTAAVWRHGPGMLNAMKQEKIAWPEFENSEMTDLIAWLNSRLVTQIAPDLPRK